MSPPRPDRVRARWISLDGDWQFEHDALHDGGRPEARSPGTKPAGRIVVPYPWESPLSGRTDLPRSYHRGRDEHPKGSAWYQRSTSVPPDWGSDRVILVIGAAYWEVSAWIDGEPVGQGESGYLPLEFDITTRVQPGRPFTLTLRVDAPIDTDEYPHGKNTLHWYTRASGIWQSVYLEARPAAWIEGFRIVTELSGRVHVSVTASNQTHAILPGRLAFRVGADDWVEAHVQLGAGISVHEIEATVRDPRPWSPADPFLYPAALTLECDAGRDDVETTFGIRTVRLGHVDGSGAGALFLNDKPVLVRAVMNQGYDPNGVYAHPSDEAIRHDLELAREAGFNMVRLHVKVEDPLVLAWADRLGMLLWCEVPNFLTPSDAARRRWERTLRGMIERDANHPSIVVWCNFIESWGIGTNQFGFGGAQRRFADDLPMQAWVRDMYELGKRLDPTRPLIENSVSDHDHTVAEINDWHLFPTGYAGLEETVRREVGEVVSNTHEGSAFNFAPGYRQARQPLWCSSFAPWDSVDGVETSLGMRILVNELRRHEQITGYGYVQLTDIEWERTGIHTYDRQPKEFGYSVHDLHDPDFLIVSAPLARVLRAGEESAVDLGLSHFSARALGRVTLRAEIAGHGPRGEELAFRVTTGLGVRPRRYRVTPMGTLRFVAPPVAFAGRLEIEAVAGDRVVATNFVQLEVLAPDDAREPMTPLPLANWHLSGGWETSEERIDVAGQLALVRMHGSGSAETAVPIPDLPDGATLHLLLEAASAKRGVEQTAAVKHPSSFTVSAGGREVAHQTVPDAPFDSRGTLSHVHGEGLGGYGYLYDVDLGRPQPDEHGLLTVHLASAPSGTGLTMFGERLGRYPLGPHLRVRARTGQD